MKRLLFVISVSTFYLAKKTAVPYNEIIYENHPDHSKERITAMNQNVREYVTEKVKELMNAFSCCAEAKEAAQNWLNAAGTDKEAEQTQNLIAELEADIMPIDTLISFADSEGGAQVFGAEKAKEVAAHGREIKSAGAIYCDCPACAACAAILSKKDELTS